jgi:hypothetical protein
VVQDYYDLSIKTYSLPTTYVVSIQSPVPFPYFIVARALGGLQSIISLVFNIQHAPKFNF